MDSTASKKTRSLRTTRSTSSRSQNSSSSSRSSDGGGAGASTKMAHAIHHLGNERKNAQNVVRQRREGERAKIVAEDESRLNLILSVQEETVSWPMKETISLLGIFNVFFLLNVDSYTRDDLMSMIAVKLCAHVLRPGLILDNASFQGLINLFDGMHVTPAVLQSLQDSSERIVRSKRSGEWLFTNLEYNKYLSGDSRKEAEPLSEIVKLLTISQMTLYKVEASLQSLALLLVSEKSVEEYSSSLFHEEGTRRTAFFRGLLELTNACARASLAENLEKVFEDLVLNPLAKVGPSEHPQQLQKLKERQDLALLHLHQAVRRLEEKKNVAFKDKEFEESSYAERRIEQSFRSLLFDRLRLLCIFCLQLVNVSAYNETGRALKLAAMLAKPTLSEKDVPLYWLICFHALLDSLGYDMRTLQAMLDLWVPPEKTRVPSLLLQQGGQVAEAKSAFLRMRTLLEHVGKTQETKRITDLFRGQEDKFLKHTLEFGDLFPESLTKEEHPRNSVSDRCRDTPDSPSYFSGIARKILEGALDVGKKEEHHEEQSSKSTHMKESEIEAIVCEVMEWFDLETGQHFFRDQSLKKPLPDMHFMAADDKASITHKISFKASRKRTPPKFRTEAQQILKSIQAHQPAPRDSKT